MPPITPIIIIILVIIVLLILATNIKVVQQSKAYVVERLGAFLICRNPKVP